MEIWARCGQGRVFLLHFILSLPGAVSVSTSHVIVWAPLAVLGALHGKRVHSPAGEVPLLCPRGPVCLRHSHTPVSTSYTRAVQHIEMSVSLKLTNSPAKTLISCHISFCWHWLPWHWFVLDTNLLSFPQIPPKKRSQGKPRWFPLTFVEHLLLSHRDSFYLKMWRP